MANISLPCGKQYLTCEVPESELLGVYHSQLPPAAEDAGFEVDRALDAPIGSPRLEELAGNAGTCVIIASDHTRPVPSKILMPRLLARLRAGNPAIGITILIATGFHRLTTRAELVSKFGEEIVASEKIVVHDSGDASQLVQIGTLPSGGALIINKLAAEADLLISEGFIEPHFFAGFSGGRKSVLPGVSSRTTVLANHCAEFIMSPYARTGILEGNPIHQDMLFAAKAAKLAFILNVVINPEKKIVAAFAGNMEKAHAAGCEFLRKAACISVPECDIAITSNGGYPLDQNVYQSVKGTTAAEAVLREGGVVVMCAACNDGHGGQSFFDNLSRYTPQEILERTLKVARDQTEADQWEFQIFARVLAHHPVVFVTTECPHDLLAAMKIHPVSTLEEGVALARRLCGVASPRIAVIPDGVSVIAEKR